MLGKSCSLCGQATDAQLKKIVKLSSDIKDLNAKQAKTSAETAKEVQNDRTLKTKNEKDRRLREKRQNNIKRFMEEKKVHFTNSDV